MKTHDRQFHSKSGNVLLFALAGMAAVGIAVGTAMLVENISLDRKATVSEGDARFLNEIVFSRAGQAIAASALLCSDVSKSAARCFWNTDNDHKLADYGFSKMVVNEAEKSLEFPATSCLPLNPESGDTSRCKAVESKVSVKLVDLNQLAQEGVLLKETLSTSESQAADGWDHYGILITVTTPYQGMGGTSDKTDYVSTAIVRRPRAIVKFEPGRAECTPTCQVPTGKTRVDAMCYGPIEVEAGATNYASIEGMKVRNEGPGYIYSLDVNREFDRANNLANVSSSAGFNLGKEKVFGFGDADARGGLAPGIEVPVTDAAMPCLHETVVHNHSVVSTQMVLAGFNGSSTSHVASTSSTSYNGVNNSRPSGKANYSLSGILPRNALRLDSMGQAVPSTQSTQTNVHYYQTVIYYRGQN